MGGPFCFLSDSLSKACKIWKQDEAVHDNYHVTLLYICLPKTVHKWVEEALERQRMLLGHSFGKISHFPIPQSSVRK